MCKWGTTEELTVTVPAHLSHTGEARTKVIGVDACIARLVAALNAAGITTVASCCGHGHLPGNVILADDTWLTLLTREQAMALNALIGVNIHGEARTDAKRVEELESALAMTDEEALRLHKRGMTGHEDACPCESCRMFAAGHHMALAHARQWRPLTDDTKTWPEEGQRVATLTRSGLLAAHSWFVEVDGCAVDAGYTTHWLPLPEPPKGESK